MPNILFTLQVPPPTAIPFLTRECFFESLDGLDVFKSGSGNVVIDPNKITITTGGTSGSVASVREQFQYPPLPLTWAKFRGFKLNLRVDVFTDPASSLFVATGNATTGGRFVGFKFTNAGILGAVCNGGSIQTVNLEVGKTPPWTETKLLEANFYPGSKAQFFIDGVLKGALTAQLPTETTNAEILFMLSLINSAPIDHSLSTSYIKAWQEQ